MKLLIILSLFAIFADTCTQNEGQMIIKHFKNGKVEVFNGNGLDYNEMEKSIKSLIKGIDQVLRVYIDEERIEKWKKNEDVIEIIFRKERTFYSDKKGNLKADKILIPVTSELTADPNSPSVNILIGDENGYVSNPYKNPAGKEQLKQLIEFLK